ncbi:amidohydrolase family protein [Parapedobacter pyrenivorans]|uniref:amidohydrolase family protein n=1 Tax=Parapedobacter pyrenivorans TaxID=1305674 RepID=UPI003342A2FD
MPDFPIIDSHVHLWDPSLLRYPWLDEIPLLNRSYQLQDYNEATKGAIIDKMVFVQCECLPSQCETEAEWVTQLAAVDPRIRGIIPWAPLELGEGARPILERYSKNPLIKGMRRIIQFESDPEFCLQDNFIRGVQLLEDYNFAFDICVSHMQLGNVIKLIECCPGVRFIIDHIGKPNIREHVVEPWRTAISSLAAFEQVYCKLSGLVTEADHGKWKQEDLSAYIRWVLAAFSTDRLVFGGDWPVVCQAAGFSDWLTILEAELTGLPQPDRTKIFYENAIKFYRLN